MSNKLDNHSRSLQQVQLASIRGILNSVPSYPVRDSIHRYERQLVETRALLFHKKTRELLSKDENKNPEARRAFVVSRVAKELWTNFCIHGQDTPMLRYLHTQLCKIYKTKYHFLYIPGSIELIINKEIDGKRVNVDKDEHRAIVNKAWEICQKIVARYIN